MPWVGLQCMVVAFHGHYTHLLFELFHIVFIFYYRGGSMISGKGVNIYKGVGFALLILSRHVS